MSMIIDIFGREVLDSRGNPTVEVEDWTELDGHGRALVHSGASTGVHEPVELRDRYKSRYLCIGVVNVVNNLNKINAQKIIEMDFLEQLTIDKTLIELDDTDNK